MARVNTAKAAKDYPQHGIKKGDTYYYWQLYKGPKQMSLNRPRPSQLTGSDKLSRVYAAVESVEDSLESRDRDEVVEALNDAADEVREVAEEYGESADNMESAFPNGSPTIEECREKQENLEAFADELEGAASDIENLDLSDFLDADARRVEAEEDLRQEKEEAGVKPEDIEVTDDEIEAYLKEHEPDSPEGLQEGEFSDFWEEVANLAQSPSCPV